MCLLPFAQTALDPSFFWIQTTPKYILKQPDNQTEFRRVSEKKE